MTYIAIISNKCIILKDGEVAKPHPRDLNVEKSLNSVRKRRANSASHLSVVDGRNACVSVYLVFVLARQDVGQQHVPEPSRGIMEMHVRIGHRVDEHWKIRPKNKKSEKNEKILKKKKKRLHRMNN